MLHLTSKVKSYPKLPYEAVLSTILGKKYELSLSFIGETRAQTINKESRNKTYVPNVLSFPLSETAGEIYICPLVAKREAKKFNMTYQGYVGFLFIHGLLHLKGYDHGATMERLEKKYCGQFGLK